MTSRLSSLVLALAALPLLSLSASAQAKPPGGRGAIGVKAERVESSDGGDAQPADGGTAKKTGQPAARNMSPKGRCRFDLSIKPDKLLPGQTGKATILMIFESDAVMEASAGLSLEPVQTQSLLAFGAMTMLPAQLSSVAEAYRGRPVYDNWAMIELPITMSLDAPIGSRQLASFNASFQLHEGATGLPLGEFQQRLTLMCDVGRALDPQVQALARRSAARAEPAEVVQRPGSAADPDHSEPPARTDPAASVAVSADPDPTGDRDPQPGVAPAPSPGAVGAWSWLLVSMVGGGALLALLLILAGRSR